MVGVDGFVISLLQYFSNCHPPPQIAWVCTTHFHFLSQQNLSGSALGSRNIARMRSPASVVCSFLPLWCPGSSPAFLTVLLIGQHFPFLFLFSQWCLYCSPKISCTFLLPNPILLWCLQFHNIFFSVHPWGSEFVHLVFSFHYRFPEERRSRLSLHPVVKTSGKFNTFAMNIGQKNERW